MTKADKDFRRSLRRQIQQYGFVEVMVQQNLNEDELFAAAGLQLVPMNGGDELLVVERD